MNPDESHADAKREPRPPWLRWALGLLLAAGFVGAVGELAAHREALHQTDAMRRTLEIHTLGLRGAVTRFEYLPFAVHAPACAGSSDTAR